MRITFFDRIVAAIAVLTLTTGTVSALSSEGLVLCVGEDGHTAREASVNGVCASDALAWQYQATIERESLIQRAEPGGHCGPCADAELLSAAHVVNTQSRAICIQIASATIVSCLKFTSLTDQPQLRFIDSGLGRGEPTFLRSVSLRI